MADTGVPSNTINTATYTTGAQIKAADHSVPHADLKAKYEGHTHDLEDNCVQDAELVDLRVRSIHASEKWALVSGTKSVTIAGGQNLKSEGITFAADAAQGDPAFTATPHFVCTHVGGGYGFVAQAASIISSAAVIRVWEMDGGTHGGTVTVHWHAYGKVA